MKIELPIKEVVLSVLEDVEQRYMGYRLDEFITGRELADRINLNHKSYKSTLSGYKNCRKFDPPLVYYATGKEHSYKWSDVVDFMDRHLRKDR